MSSIQKGFRSIVHVIAIVALSLALAAVPASAAITPPSTAYSNAVGATLSTNLGLVSTPITADVNTVPVRIGAYSTCSLQYVTAVGTSNATTVKLQGSNTQGAWEDYAFNVITSATTAQSSYYGFNVPTFEYVRLNIDVTNANPVTFTTGLFCK